MFTISIGYLLIGITKIYILILLGVILIGFGTSFWHAPAFGTLAARYPERKGFALSMHLTGAQIGIQLDPYNWWVDLRGYSWLNHKVLRLWMGKCCHHDRYSYDYNRGFLY
ncbi:MAG: hypothetical protein Ct9H90mP2_05950 [Dehalococcoidia bacterium]|nr:MAG: hypothetical protein Ct9H90mP2_05950 [Dehalococcoidia bacterium]